jgi:hypothetical protein
VRAKSTSSPAPEVEERVESPSGAVDDAEVDPILDRVAAPSARSPRGRTATDTVGLRTARVERVEGRRAWLSLRSRAEPVEAEIADDVDVPLIERACASQERVEVHGKEVHIRAEDQVVIRAGDAALKLQSDGDVEMIGTRILAKSRGLFRLVGRALRLN